MIRVSILWQEVVVKLMNSKSVLSHFITNLDKIDYEFLDGPEFLVQAWALDNLEGSYIMSPATFQMVR